MHKIVTNCWAKPIPMRRFDCEAWYDDDEPDDYGNMAVGYGATVEGAVIDLIENHPRPDVFCPERGR